MSELIRQAWGSTPSATGQKRTVYYAVGDSHPLNYSNNETESETAAYLTTHGGVGVAS